MAWSRLAKKFRDEEPTPASTAQNQKVSKAQLKKLAARMAAPSAPPKPQPVAEQPAPAPVVEAAPAGPPKPSKRTREVPKRPRFVYTPPPKTEKKDPAAKPALPAVKPTKLATKLMTKNLALPPEEDSTPVLPGQFRP